MTESVFRARTSSERIGPGAPGSGAPRTVTSDLTVR